MGKKKVPSRTVGDTPTPPITKRSLNPAIIDDNIAKLEKAIKAGDVTPNPSGTSEETLLTSIGIDGKKYDIGASAENVSYNNTDSGLTADNAQGAIDEVSSTLNGILPIINNLKSVEFGEFSTEFPDKLVSGVKLMASNNRYVIIGGIVGGTTISTDDKKSIFIYSSWDSTAYKVICTSL